ncbi:hypothetical protein G6M26_07960 [Agrobacterium tumefaciens]|nr:hypothetical protein [Agrobacterium tumefaciens]NTE18456.1 hypothetical protein [Agrobacterium tumefaciens]
MKDIEILDRKLGRIGTIEWHCFDGVDEAFIKNVSLELKKANIDIANFKIIKY